MQRKIPSDQLSKLDKDQSQFLYKFGFNLKIDQFKNEKDFNRVDSLFHFHGFMSILPFQ
jgi:hypothetical protein